MNITDINDSLNKKFRGKKVTIRIQDPFYHEREFDRDVTNFTGVVVDSFVTFTIKKQEVVDIFYMDGSPTKKMSGIVGEYEGISVKLVGHDAPVQCFKIHKGFYEDLEYDEGEKISIVYDNAHQIPNVAVLKVEM